MKPRLALKKSVVAVVAAIAFGSGNAVTIQDSMSKAVLTNPDVQSKWHLFSAAGAEREVVWGRHLPTLDYVFGFGNERKYSPVIQPEDDYEVKVQSLTARLSVFEGGAIQNDVIRLEHAQAVRYYELLEISETAAVEAAKAYIDVYRFRRLVQMAEDNYATHRVIYEKINKRAKSGVGRGVDLEIAGGRLALAESNLLTEGSNLYDVTARYQRVVGESPKGELDPPPTGLAKILPKTREEAIVNGFSNSPTLKAAVQNILSSQRQVDVQRAAYAPRVEAYADNTRRKNDNALHGITNTSGWGMTLSWNLFRGFSDNARVDQAAAESSSAKDTRERVCRDLRSNLSTAFNDHVRLVEQLPFLDQHQLSTDKSREALRKQFDIGQRSLLDVLDTENEYYNARRNYLNGEMDDVIAQVKYFGAAGTLLSTLKLKHLEAEPVLAETELDADAVNQCPPEPAPYQVSDKDALYKKAQAKDDLLRTSATQAQEKTEATQKANADAAAAKVGTPVSTTPPKAAKKKP